MVLICHPSIIIMCDFHSINILALSIVSIRQSVALMIDI